jgi:uncharacterized protein YhfF
MANSIEISYEWDFGDDRELAEKLKRLVLSGEKKATTGICHQWQKIPKAGEYAAILDSDKRSFCVIRYTKVHVKPFLEVGYDFIQKEGEGDRNVEEWRERHRKFFNLTDDNVEIVCEEFEVVSCC